MSTEWRYHVEGDFRHVWPISDSKTHNMSDDRVCPCNPTLYQAEEGIVIVVHHAYDGRPTEDWTPTNEELL